jgi:ComF family protein
VLALLELLAPTPCLGCDEPLRSTGDELCPACRPGLIPWPGASAAFEYGGPLAEAIRRYKYEGRSELAVRLARLMLAELAPARTEVDVVLPVPLHWRRRRARGYDQAALLAAGLARGLGLPLRTRWLRRVRDTRSQVGLSEVEREKNLAGAFRACAAPKPLRVLLIDDVRTTGATLRAASQSLSLAGFSFIRPFTLAARL